ncbi:hypothetical protein PIB30_043061 [Stylosanthes scabra]|uniref:Secreted protein n=1 Tax=Stylosanthes scabra TaxID=79078 RepID=A0ABU6QF20_9FABA|nr:hypothetical protein [Stylosanthes scabra]
MLKKMFQRLLFDALVLLNPSSTFQPWQPVSSFSDCRALITAVLSSSLLLGPSLQATAEARSSQAASSSPSLPVPPASATIHCRSLKQYRLLLFSFSDRPTRCNRKEGRHGRSKGVHH